MIHGLPWGMSGTGMSEITSIRLSDDTFRCRDELYIDIGERIVGKQDWHTLPIEGPYGSPELPKVHIIFTLCPIHEQLVIIFLFVKHMSDM